MYRLFVNKGEGIFLLQIFEFLLIKILAVFYPYGVLHVKIGFT